jgi:hypothetical protein
MRGFAQIMCAINPTPKITAEVKPPSRARSINIPGKWVYGRAQIRMDGQRR